MCILFFLLNYFLYKINTRYTFMCLNLCCTSIHIALMKLLLRDGALTSNKSAKRDVFSLDLWRSYVPGTFWIPFPCKDWQNKSNLKCNYRRPCVYYVLYMVMLHMMYMAFSHISKASLNTCWFFVWKPLHQ